VVDRGLSQCGFEGVAIDTLPLVERNVVRLVVLDARDHVLLLHTRDASNPAFGTLWELPGGGMEDGESFIETAVRELREETGIEIRHEHIPPPTWRRDVSYTYRGMRRLQHELISAVRLQQNEPAIAAAQRVDFEREDLFGARWWAIEEIAAGGEHFYPRSLPALLREFLAGREIEEPEERWD